ncbi:DUF4190 domain-containing protein [Nocardioides sp. WS12]|uniref:DUF4190 domain-containing protein n=1 Tax=Nocardioides sp. WS12 TaxID=2486272 RepID=UPI001F28EEDC|nr:DUF4190 domain-containing protein [Nocardioides sp. WS12]
MVSQFCGTCGAPNSGTPFCPGCGTRHDVEASTATVLRSALKVAVAPPPPPPPPAAAFAPASPAYSPSLPHAVDATPVVGAIALIALATLGVFSAVVPDLALPGNNIAISTTFELISFGCAAALLGVLARRDRPAVLLVLLVAAGYVLALLLWFGLFGRTWLADGIAFWASGPIGNRLPRALIVVLLILGTSVVGYLAARMTRRAPRGAAAILAGILATVVVGLAIAFDVLFQNVNSIIATVVPVAACTITGLLGALVAVLLPATTQRAPMQAWPSAVGSVAVPTGPTALRTNTFAILALVFGLLGGLLAIPLGHIARSQIRRTGEGGAGMATAGLVLGYLALVLWAALVTFLVIAYNSI